LIGQLYASIDKSEKAYTFFEKSISITTDPLMEAYARIKQISGMGRGKDESKRIEDNIQALLNLAGKEKYISFKPIIFSSIAVLELKRNNFNSAIEYLKKSNLNNQGDQGLKNNNFIKIVYS
jgi:tetratricopeptide (TPR) repeat protein